jgi:hypothetical protein
MCCSAAVPVLLAHQREPDRRTKREAYPEQFNMTLEDIKNAPEVPTIPPLVSQN